MEETRKSGVDNVREQLRLALTHLSNAQKDCDLAGIIDALELGFARDCVATALRDCHAIELEMADRPAPRPGPTTVPLASKLPLTG